MPDADAIAALEVPENVRRVLTDVLRKAREVFNADLLSVVLYGSAAAGQMRPTSDVNLLLVLKRLDFSAGERLNETLGVAEAAVGLKVMFLLEAEVADAATAFALKFADITDRHVLLYGRDPFAALAVPRGAKIFRLKQVLLNLVLRMREAFIRSAGDEKQRAASPKEALDRVAAEIDPAAFADALARSFAHKRNKRANSRTSRSKMLNIGWNNSGSGFISTDCGVLCETPAGSWVRIAHRFLSDFQLNASSFGVEFVEHPVIPHSQPALRSAS